MKEFFSLRDYIIRDRWYLACGFAALIGVDLLQLVIPLVLKSAVDDLTLTSVSGSTLLQHGLLIAAIGAAAAVLRFIWRYCIVGTSRRIETALRDRLFAHAIHLPLAGLVNIRTGDLMSRMTNDLDAVRMCTGIGIVAMIDTVVLGLASVIFMACLSMKLALLCLMPMLIIILATWRMGGLLHRRFSLVQASFSRMTEMVRETLAGIAVIRAFAREPDNAGNFTAISADYISKNMALVKIWGSLFPFIVFISNISVCVLIFFGGRYTIEGSITPGDFVAFANYIWLLIWPMIALGWIVNLFQRGAASMARINAVLAMPAEPFEKGRPGPCAAEGNINIRNLSFTYASSAGPALKDVSLAIPAGSTIGITGTTGSGKSTLCSLLLRFFDPPGGSILLDGTDICDIPLKELRSCMAYVPQDSFLFSDTLMSNIVYGRPDASAEEAAAQADLAQMTGEIMSFSSGFATLIGEKGITLSGGQKQRLCIARALLMKTPVLIFDDALSSLDAATTQHLVEKLKAQAGSKTCIIISNRIASIQHADTIYVFDGGSIAAQGTHAGLLAGGGLYYQLYQRQKLEEAEVAFHV
jgi:ATP-binding cassette, subfamily B, multidrug efflux pump